MTNARFMTYQPSGIDYCRSYKDADGNRFYVNAPNKPELGPDDVAVWYAPQDRRRKAEAAMAEKFWPEPDSREDDAETTTVPYDLVGYHIDAVDHSGGWTADGDYIHERSVDLPEFMD